MMLMELEKRSRPPCISTRLEYRIESVARDDFIERLEKYALSYTILRMDTTLYYGNGHLRPDLLILIEIEGSEYKLVVNTEHETNSVEGYYKRTEK